jgi:hypothetical protein
MPALGVDEGIGAEYGAESLGSVGTTRNDNVIRSEEGVRSQ